MSESLPRFAVFTSELCDAEPPQCVFVSDSDSEAIRYAQRELRDENGAPVVWVIDTQTGLEVRLRQPRRQLVVRKATLQGHAVKIVEVA